MSRLQQLRAEFKPSLPELLNNLKAVCFDRGEATSCIADESKIRKRFSHTLVVFWLKANLALNKSLFKLKLDSIKAIKV